MVIEYVTSAVINWFLPFNHLSSSEDFYFIRIN